MIFILGGYAAGKRSYVRDVLGYTDDQMADGELSDKPVVYNVQDMAARFPPDELLAALCQKDVVIANEVGAGVIPIDKDQRLAREAAGRLSVLLAQRAQRVIRIVCGLPMELK